MPVEIQLPDLPEIAIGSRAYPPRPQRQPWHLRWRDGLSSYLPLLLMGALALATWWLVKHTPGAPAPRDQVLPEPDINQHARGCVTSTAALAAIGLLVVMAVFGLVIVLRARPEDSGILWMVYCLTIVPLLAMTIGLYVGARSREERIEADAEERSAAIRRQLGGE